MRRLGIGEDTRRRSLPRSPTTLRPWPVELLAARDEGDGAGVRRSSRASSWPPSGPPRSGAPHSIPVTERRTRSTTRLWIVRTVSRPVNSRLSRGTMPPSPIRPTFAPAVLTMRHRGQEFVITVRRSRCRGSRAARSRGARRVVEERLGYARALDGPADSDALLRVALETESNDCWSAESSAAIAPPGSATRRPPRRGSRGRGARSSGRSGTRGPLGDRDAPVLPERREELPPARRPAGRAHRPAVLGSVGASRRRTASGRGPGRRGAPPRLRDESGEEHEVGGVRRGAVVQREAELAAGAGPARRRSATRTCSGRTTTP